MVEIVVENHAVDVVVGGDFAADVHHPLAHFRDGRIENDLLRGAKQPIGMRHLIVPRVAVAVGSSGGISQRVYPCIHFHALFVGGLHHEAERVESRCSAAASGYGRSIWFVGRSICGVAVCAGVEIDGVDALRTQGGETLPQRFATCLRVGFGDFSRRPCGRKHWAHPYGPVLAHYVLTGSDGTERAGQEENGGVEFFHGEV